MENVVINAIRIVDDRFCNNRQLTSVLRNVTLKNKSEMRNLKPKAFTFLYLLLDRHNYYDLMKEDRGGCLHCLT